MAKKAMEEREHKGGHCGQATYSALEYRDGEARPHRSGGARPREYMFHANL